MTAGEDHAQLAVPDLVFQEYLVHRLSRCALGFEQGIQVDGEGAIKFFTFDGVDGFAFGHDHKPSGRVVGDAAETPVFECLVKGILQDVFSQLEVVDAEDAGQDGDHPPRLMPEKMVDQLTWILLWRMHALWLVHRFELAEFQPEFAQQGTRFR